MVRSSEILVSRLIKQLANAIQPSETIAAAAARMRDRGGGLLVVVEGEQIAGVITDRDIVTRCIAANHSPRTRHVRD